MTEASRTVPFHRNLIDGRWTGEPGAARRNPSGPGEVVATVAEATPKLVRAAGDAARRAFAAWSAVSPVDRGRILAAAARLLEARSEEIAAMISREEGKTLAEAGVEVARAVDYLAFFAAEGWHLGGETLASEDPRQTIMTVREPLGVVAAITPWNFPLAIPAWKIAPALVAGNAVVLKPAALAAGPAVALAEALIDAGLPDGVLNVVQGDGAVVGEALVDHPELDALTFTGSNRVGGLIAARLAGRPVRLQTELGGVNALVVMADADLDVAADLAARGAFGLTGQACTATRQVLCQRSALDEFLERLRLRADAINGVPAAMGPAVSETAAQQIRATVDRAVAAGARVVAGSEPGSGASVSATVLADLPSNAPLLREEVFGPVLAVVPIDDLEEAIERIDDSPFGLAAGIVTASLSDAMTFAKRVRVGTVKINRTTTGNQPNIPFGGVKASSNGFAREQGREALQFFSRTKSIYLGW